jgi:uncharacterized protein (TIGR03083 family)
MDYDTYVRHVGDDGRRLIAVSAGALEADVPSCPGWTARDVVTHVAQVYEHKIRCTELGVAPDPWPPDWPAGRDPIEWLTDAHDRLLEMFARSGPTTPSATWWPPDQTVGFWARRMAQETAVHRVDVELAADTPSPVDPALAVDGVDEVLRLMLAGDWSDEPDPRATGQRVAVSTGGAAWIVTIDREAVEVAEGDGTHDAAVVGEPSDVLLWLWGRAPDDRVTREGDVGAIATMRDRLVLATQ